MAIVNITPTFSVSDELRNEQFDELARKGVKTLINVRPDNEALGQINSADYAEIATRYNIRYYHLPVISGVYANEDIALFAKYLGEHDQKVHSCCRTGTRAIHLWALAQAKDSNFADLNKQAKAAGYDLAAIEAQWRQLS